MHPSASRSQVYILCSSWLSSLRRSRSNNKKYTTQVSHLTSVSLHAPGTCMTSCSSSLEAAFMIDCRSHQVMVKSMFTLSSKSLAPIEDHLMI